MKSLSHPLHLARWVLAGAAVAAFPSAASAHFVWVEPSTATPGAAQVCFGEYPSSRETAPLLDKVQGVKLFALDGKSRRELKQARGENHFRYEGVENAPVLAGSLDYGMLQRGQNPPYLLRYETVLLRGQGKPLSLGEIAQLSQIQTDLPLAVSFKPSAAGKLQLTTTLNGKPVAADVVIGNPGEQELKTKVRTSESGTLELPVPATGWYHLRLSAEDQKPVTFQGKEGKFTRTYLSVMFQAEKAAGTAATAAVKTDAEAIRLLKDAHEARAHWNNDFPGFTADAVYTWNGKEYKGTITVESNLSIKYNLGNKEAETSLRPSFGSLIMHRAGGSEGSPDYAASWKDAEAHSLGRAINLNDKYGSWYRVKDRQILQVNRNMGSQRFTTNVLENESSRSGILPRAWTVSYYDNATNALLRSSTTHVTWKWMGNIFLPVTVQNVNAHNESTEVTGLVLSNHKLLK